MKKNILKESAQETVANCSANDLKRILGGEPTRNGAGELDYFTENSVNPKLRRAHPDLFFDIKYLRIFPKADKNTYYDEQEGPGDPDDNKWAWQIYVTTLNDTTSDNTRAVVRIKDFIEGNLRNQINEVKKLQKIAGILKEDIGTAQNSESPEQIARDIFDDISAERGDQMELMGMSPDVALETVEAYGYTGEFAQDIAGYLMDLIG